MIAAILAVLLAGCLGPLTSDTPAPSGQLLPAGTPVPSIEQRADLVAQIRAGQHVFGTVPQYAGFGGGAPLLVWDFGPVPARTAPQFVLVDSSGVPIDHPEIVDFLPGDAGYAPFWSVWHVAVTARYAGEQVTSVAALDDALREGLVEAPIATAQAEHGPIVTADIRLARAKALPAAPADIFYYRGYTVTYFALGQMPLDPDKVTVPVARRSVLRREGGEPLSEVIRGVDMDGDGDADDTNDLFATGAGTPAFQTVEVVVAAQTASIDTTHDQTRAALEDDRLLFAPQPTAAVIAYTTTDEIRDLVPASALGGP